MSKRILESGRGRSGQSMRPLRAFLTAVIKYSFRKIVQKIKAKDSNTFTLSLEPVKYELSKKTNVNVLPFVRAFNDIKITIEYIEEERYVRKDLGDCEALIHGTMNGVYNTVKGELTVNIAYPAFADDSCLKALLEDYKLMLTHEVKHSLQSDAGKAISSVTEWEKGKADEKTTSYQERIYRSPQLTKFYNQVALMFYPETADPFNEVGDDFYDRMYYYISPNEVEAYNTELVQQIKNKRKGLYTDYLKKHIKIVRRNIAIAYDNLSDDIKDDLDDWFDEIDSDALTFLEKYIEIVEDIYVIDAINTYPDIKLSIPGVNRILTGQELKKIIA